MFLINSFIFNLYKISPKRLKNIFSRELRQKIKILLRFAEFKDPEYRKTFLKIKEAKMFLSKGDFSNSFLIWEELNKVNRVGFVRAFDGEIRYYRKLTSILLDDESYKKNLKKYTEVKRIKNNQSLKIAVYSAIIGKYDSYKEPLFIDPRFDYILFTDEKILVSDQVKVLPMTYSSHEPTRSARFIKTHPHVLLKEYDLAIWVDASIGIVDDIYNMVDNFLGSGLPIGAVIHPYRDNIFQELEACKALSKDDSDVMEAQVSRYRDIKFTHNKLIESGFMIFDLRNEKTSEVLGRWWSEIELGSKRDQLSFNYALGEQSFFSLMKENISIRNHPSLTLLPHAKGKNYIAEKYSGKICDPFINSDPHINQLDIVSKFYQTKIDILLCVHNALEDVKKCLNSIDQNHNSPNHRLIIIDDGSGLETIQYLQEFISHRDWCLMERSEVGRGYTKAANHALSLSDGEVSILLNSDTIVTKNWCEKLAFTLFSDPKIGIVGPISNAASHQSIPNHHSKNKQTAINDLPEGYTPEDMNQFCEEKSSLALIPLVPLVHGFCFAIKREVIEKIGYFDDASFPRGYGEENDYCFRASDAGFLLAVATHTYIYHSKSKSYDSEKRIGLMKEGAKMLAQKHGRVRVINSVRAMERSPILGKLRQQSEKIYKKK